MMISKMLRNACAAAVLTLGMAVGVHADPITYGFNRLEANSSVDTSSFYQLIVSSVTGNASQVDFTFKNLSTNPALDATIKSVYFDDGALLGIHGLIEGTGVDFKTSGGSTLPGKELLDPDFETTAGFYANFDGGNGNGVQPGEELKVRFNLQTGKGFADVITFLNDGLDPGFTGDTLRVGIHVGSLPGPTGGTAKSDSFYNGSGTSGGPTPVVPLPASVWAGMALLGGLGLMKLNARRQLA